ncbi:MAG: hypothetical protein V4722_14670 [Bacteroidota bacterium]
MKTKLLLILMVCIAVTGFSQNAFYNTRKILSWRDEVIKLNSGPITDSTTLKKKAYLDSITSMVFYYTGEKKWDSIIKYTGMAELYHFVTGQLINTSVLKKQFSEVSALGNVLRRDFNEIKSLLDNIDDYSTASRKWSELMYNNSDTSSFNNNYHPVYSNPGNDTSWARSQPKFILDNWKQALDSFRRERSKADRELNVASKKLAKAIEDNKVALLQALQGRTISFRADILSTAAGFATSVKTSFDNSTSQALNNNQEAVQRLKNFSFPSQSDIIDALAIYLAKRVKQEAVLAFTDQLRKNLKTDTLLNVFFPETKRLFLSLPDYDFPRFGSAWRYAISKDFIQLPDNFFNSHYAKRWFGDNYPCFNDVYQVATLIRKKYTFLEIVEDLSTRQEESDMHDVLQTDAFKQFVNIAHVINKELFNKEANTLYWLNAELWTNSTREEFNIFWALINEKYPAVLSLIHFSTERQDTRYALSLVTEKKIKLWIKRILSALNKFQENQDELYQASLIVQDKNWEFNVATYWSNIHEIVKMVIDNELVSFHYRDLLGKIDITMERLFNVYEAIQHKNYASAVEETLHMIETFVKGAGFITASEWRSILNDTHFKLNSRGEPDDNGVSLPAALQQLTVPGHGSAKQLLDSLVNAADNRTEPVNMAAIPNMNIINDLIKKYAAKFEIYRGITLTEKLELLLSNDNPLYVKLVKNNPAAITVIRKAAAIFEDIISTTNSEALSKVIESYALPPGSYKVKRRSAFNIDLNAYFGIYAGVEWAQNGNGKYTWNNSGTVFGLSAPIGVSFSWAGLVSPQTTGVGEITLTRKGHKLKRFKGTSHTFSLGIIDIGAVVSYRISNSADKPLPEKLKWGQVLSPAINYRYGLKGTPLCLGLGLQYAPLLRSVNGSPYSNTIRLSASLMMDLPMFNLYRRQ